MNQRSIVPFLAILLLMVSCESPSIINQSEDPSLVINTQKKGPVIHYQGRIDTSNNSKPVLIWQGTTLETTFTGHTLQVGFSQLKGQVYFDVEIDGDTTLLKAQNGWTDLPLLTNSGNLKHTVRLFKRSEARAGHVRFLGFKTQDNDDSNKMVILNDFNLNQKNHLAKKFLFFGDSITAGACNEDPEGDQWKDRSTHNNALSYGAITAETLGAEYRNISISGMGLTTGYIDILFKEVWDRIYPDPNSEKADLSLWQPNIIFINLGENDDSYTRSKKRPFPHNYTSEYIAAVKKIRLAYPNSTIVILRGGMYGGARSKGLLGPWKEVVKTLKAEDGNIKSFAFKHFSSGHPRVNDHKKMAQELSDWLKKNT